MIDTTTVYTIQHVHSTKSSFTQPNPNLLPSPINLSNRRRRLPTRYSLSISLPFAPINNDNPLSLPISKSGDISSEIETSFSFSQHPKRSRLQLSNVAVEQGYRGMAQVSSRVKPSPGSNNSHRTEIPRSREEGSRLKSSSRLGDSPGPIRRSPSKKLDPDLYDVNGMGAGMEMLR